MSQTRAEKLRVDQADVCLETDPLSPVLRPSMFWTPERLAPSAWLEHVPFAFWLIDVLRPRIIVELGTHYGVSYSAMCQAVKSLGLATSCFAVDTWKGDEQAGFYSEDVYRDLASFHDLRYSAFSRLMRLTFDEALLNFEDGSIDLLHIDGRHTYEAVRHDYELWLPKLSTHAVLLFHDTNVHAENFGVHQLWREISENRTHFEFLHGNGLGILGFDDRYSEALNLLFDARGNDSLTANIRLIFSQLGYSARLPFELQERETRVSALEATIGTIQKSLSWRLTAPLRAVRGKLNKQG